MVNQASRKIAVVTGASSGIGAVYAQRLAARGYDLWLVARRADRLRELASEIGGAHGVNVETVVADLTSEADLQRVEQRIAAEANIHVLVNNAGLARLRPVAQSSVADTATQIALNTTALVRLTQAVVPGFVARNEGAIINIASVLALDTLPVSAVYSGTKGFVLNYTRGLQLELANTGVKVQAVLPAATATEIWDESGVPLDSLAAGTVMRTEDMVDAALEGFDQGEAITMPSVHDAQLLHSFEEARQTLFRASQNGTAAPRYRA
ncbi:SDR family oxidoreductase [Caballeronia sp. LZ001]|uniref:SDR family NAD(P)-dependent oxidoreductase n=1 Tax=Caballeronia sp. LZ001 TaxID=3038553 RepID=UPI00285DDBA3|nr:SDR family oxidoreductase [Caballeronia sp. LZ001]MDR5805689.1 SDR family oxidoreductase [Caballeronia sp. LZ001]